MAQGIVDKSPTNCAVSWCQHVYVELCIRTGECLRSPTSITDTEQTGNEVDHAHLRGEMTERTSRV